MTRILVPILAASLLVPALADAKPKAPSFTASSMKKTEKIEYAPAMAFDGLLSTSWAEDKPGLGEEEWLEIDLGEERAVSRISIWAGAFANAEDWGGRGRISDGTVTLMNAAGEVVKNKSFEVGDRYARQDIRLGDPIAVQKLRITIDAVHEGSIFADTHISEVAFDFHEPVDAAWGEAIAKKIEKSRSLKKIVEADPEEFAVMWTALKADEEYSSNFKLLGARAVRGPEYRIELVQEAVPPGFRLQHLQFDETSVEKLGVLKDGNAVRYLEAASAGAVLADDREWLGGAIVMFKAYQDLRKAVRATLPNWGTTGLEQGALLGRGEPLSADVDSAGNVWIADTGNNRLQRFNAAGTADKVIGGTKTITTDWFGEDGDPYASGSDVGDGPGQFHQPIALAVGNYDIIATIDSRLRMQTFDAEGVPKAQWVVSSTWQPRSGLGNGTPIITWLGDDFFVILKDEVLQYTADGELKTRYNLEGGDVQAAVIAKGRLLVRHSGESEIIEYKPEDGFRQGKFNKKPVPEDGSEDWDLASDADDNLYIATDAGKIHKFNKRGRFVTTIDAFEKGREMPRIAVSGPLILVVARDEIARVEQTE
jgi:hypothetical protein